MLQKLAPANYRIKWPNDVLINQQKLAGILIECKSDFQNVLSVVIGVGINVKLPTHFLDNNEYPIADLYQIALYKLNRNKLLAHFLTELYQLIEIFNHSGFGPFRDEWMSLHCFQNQPVELYQSTNQIIEGIAIGVSSEGELILLTDRGYQKFTVGDISLRPKIQI